MSVTEPKVGVALSEVRSEFYPRRWSGARGRLADPQVKNPIIGRDISFSMSEITVTFTTTITGLFYSFVFTRGCFSIFVTLESKFSLSFPFLTFLCSGQPPSTGTHSPKFPSTGTHRPKFPSTGTHHPISPPMGTHHPKCPSTGT